jgi:hypothetical protein
MSPSAIFSEHMPPPPPASALGDTPLSRPACPLEGEEKIAVKEQLYAPPSTFVPWQLPLISVPLPLPLLVNAASHVSGTPLSSSVSDCPLTVPE